MPRKSRTYEDYAELGRAGFESREALTRSVVKASRMWPHSHAYVKRLDKILTQLGQLRSDIDNTYCQEIDETGRPAGSRKFPMYPGPEEAA